jgi:hypothetical protein
MLRDIELFRNPVGVHFCTNKKTLLSLITTLLRSIVLKLERKNLFCWINNDPRVPSEKFEQVPELTLCRRYRNVEINLHFADFPILLLYVRPVSRTIKNDTLLADISKKYKALR